MKITRSYISVNPFSRVGTRRTSTKGVVWHYTANPGATAYGHYLYFDSLKNQDPRDDDEDRYASAHTFIDRYGIVEIIPLQEKAYHASTANATHIGVELCIEKDGSFHPDTIKQAIEYGVYLAKMYGLDPMTDFIRHYDVTRKLCPKRWVEHPVEWLDFRKDVLESMTPKFPLKRGDAKLIIDKYLKPAYGAATTAEHRKNISTAANQIRLACGAKEDEQL